MISLAMQKLSSLIRSLLFIFAVVSFALGDIPQKILLQVMSKSVLPMFSSMSLMVLIHFEFIFYVCCEEIF